MTRAEIIRKIYNEIDNLPSIPENIIKIQNIIQDPRSDINIIAQYVKRDVGLTANILRIANSPWYMPIMRVDSVDRAISLIGLRRLYSIVLAIAAKKVLTERMKSIKDAWKHSYQCAFFAQQLMKQRRYPMEDIELGYIAGLLHDMGKVVFLSLSSDLINRMTNLSESKKVSISDIEKAALGLTHSEVGGKIANKWKFPKQLINAVTYHHEPDEAGDKNFNFVAVTYLSNIFCHHKEYEPVLYTSINKAVLTELKITTETQFEAIHKTLYESYSITPDIRFF